MKRLINFFRRLFRGRKKYTMEITVSPALPGKGGTKLLPIVHVTGQIAKSSAEAKRRVRKRERGRPEGPLDRGDPVIRVIREEDIPRD